MRLAIAARSAKLKHTLSFYGRTIFFLCAVSNTAIIVHKLRYLFIQLRHASIGFHEGIRMFRVGDNYMVKQLQLVGANRLQAVSINEKYPVLSINKDDDFELVGHAIFRGENL